MTCFRYVIVNTLHKSDKNIIKIIIINKKIYNFFLRLVLS